MRNLQPFLSRNHQNPLLLHPSSAASGFGFWNQNGSRSSYSSRSCRAVERDSQFEIDPDKAREALRKLDQQLDLISQKQISPLPKPKASSPYSERDYATNDIEDKGSILPYAAFGLLLFTVVYNILFITVIKPSIDGPQVELAPVRSSIMTEILNGELRPSPSPDIPIQP